MLNATVDSIDELPKLIRELHLPQPESTRTVRMVCEINLPDDGEFL